MDARPPSLRELAAKLGLSHAAVSMALRNHPSISLATRERVQALAKQMNYRGNILVSALLAQVRRRRVNATGEVIAMLVEGEGLKHAPTVAVSWEPMQQRAQQLGLKLEAFALGHRGRDSASVERVLFNRGIRGVIVAPMPLDLLPLHIDWNRHTAIAIGHSFQQVVIHRVANAHFSGLMTAHRELRASGRTSIGCVLHKDEDERSLHFWQAAALCAPRLYGGRVIPPLMIGKEPGEAAFNQWFDEHKPDAVIGNNPDPVVGWLRRRRVRVPAEVGYASMDLPQGAKFPGVRQAWLGIFTTAIDQLAGELARNEFGLPATPRTTLIEGQWVAGPKRKAR
ncbi:LacI family DNA-binding transcriptional regulator [Rariglobus hedericola]|uniref:LacI family transcriptional regulator n=1 Tax=Rariglobus hedericola TaxID=2597822 RepID=A0A556QJH4_9BACT|nr:LacI family DNA-binding transcriptional regulator [Rariglobus hedericola]TSJ76796.1 LacI family transcriptional regulator [Rariglobus hedericola]